MNDDVKKTLAECNKNAVSVEVVSAEKIAGQKLATDILKQAMVNLEKTGDLQLFEVEQIQSVLTNKLSPLVLLSGNMSFVYAYEIIKKLLGKMRKDLLKSQEGEGGEDNWEFPRVDFQSNSIENW